MPAFRFDGKDIPYQAGDTLASALHRADVLEISRSMKYHRPRGIFCNTGSCASCFVNVDGVPNVPACMTAAAGCEVKSQNRLGSAKRDLLAITDKVYKKGFDPHGAFTKSKLMNKAFMQAVRVMSGWGKVPAIGHEPVTARYHEHEIDHLIIGGGRSGLEAALAAKGDVVIVDELPRLGGSANWYEEPRTDDLADMVRHNGWVGAVAFGIYDDVVAVAHNGDLHAVRAKHITIAPGRHDVCPIFPNNDLPGIMSMRGARRLMAHGVLPGKAVVCDPAAPADVRARIEELGGEIVAEGTVQAAMGGTRVEGAQLDDVVDCDAILTERPGTPRIELFQQAGCELAFENGVLVPKVNKSGRTSRKDITWGRP